MWFIIIPPDDDAGRGSELAELIAINKNKIRKQLKLAISIFPDSTHYMLFIVQGSVYNNTKISVQLFWMEGDDWTVPPESIYLFERHVCV